MVTRPVRELTTDLPRPPAPHLGPTVVRVDNPDLRRTILIGRLIVIVLIGLPSLTYFLNSYVPLETRAWVFAVMVLVFVCLFTWVWRPERVRAGSNWLSVHGARRWVELDKLTHLDLTKNGNWTFCDSRYRCEPIDSRYLRHCPILFDLLMRGVMRSEAAGTMKSFGASERLMDSAPRGYRRPERWDSDW
jgi:hypothetical protein